MSLQRGDVILIQFPFTDLTSFKVRPALVLSSDQYNSQGEDVIVCLITSNLSRKGVPWIPVTSDHPDYARAGFKTASAIIPDKIHALHRILIKRKLGSLGAQTLNVIQDRLREIIFN